MDLLRSFGLNDGQELLVVAYVEVGVLLVNEELKLLVAQVSGRQGFALEGQSGELFLKFGESGFQAHCFAFLEKRVTWFGSP